MSFIHSTQEKVGKAWAAVPAAGVVGTEAAIAHIVAGSPQVETDAMVTTGAAFGIDVILTSAAKGMNIPVETKTARAVINTISTAGGAAYNLATKGRLNAEELADVATPNSLTQVAIISLSGLTAWMGNAAGRALGRGRRR